MLYLPAISGFGRDAVRLPWSWLFESEDDDGAPALLSFEVFVVALVDEYLQPSAKATSAATTIIVVIRSNFFISHLLSRFVATTSGPSQADRPCPANPSRRLSASPAAAVLHCHHVSATTRDRHSSSRRESYTDLRVESVLRVCPDRLPFLCRARGFDQKLQRQSSGRG